MHWSCNKNKSPQYVYLTSVYFIRIIWTYCSGLELFKFVEYSWGNAKTFQSGSVVKNTDVWISSDTILAMLGEMLNPAKP